MPTHTPFNTDVRNHNSYLYTNGSLSALLANDRISRAISAYIPRKAKTLLDIGCGDGTYTAELARNKVRVMAYDPSREAIRVAKKQFRSIKFYVGSIYTKHPHCDVGVIRGVLHHLKDPAMALRAMKSSAKLFIIVEPNGDNPILRLFEKNSRYHIEHNEKSYSRRFLVDALVREGYAIHHIKHIGVVPFFFPTPLALLAKLIEPVIEKIPFLRSVLTAQLVIVCSP